MTVTLYRLDTGQPFIAGATEQTNSDGSVSYLVGGAEAYAGQEPGQYGVRNDASEAKQYQRATRDGAIVTFQPHPAFMPCSYLRGAGQVYPA